MTQAVLLAAFAALALPTAAMAADGERQERRLATSREQAIRIAAGYGMVQVTELEQDDGGWEIEGRDHRGRELEVKIDRHGRVVSVQRGNDD